MFDITFKIYSTRLWSTICLFLKFRDNLPTDFSRYPAKRDKQTALKAVPANKRGAGKDVVTCEPLHE